VVYDGRRTGRERRRLALSFDCFPGSLKSVIQTGRYNITSRYAIFCTISVTECGKNCSSWNIRIDKFWKLPNFQLMIISGRTVPKDINFENRMGYKGWKQFLSNYFSFQIHPHFVIWIFIYRVGQNGKWSLAQISIDRKCFFSLDWKFFFSLDQFFSIFH